MAGSGMMSSGSAPRLLQGRGATKSSKTSPSVGLKCQTCGRALSASNMIGHLKTHSDNQNDPYQSTDVSLK